MTSKHIQMLSKIDVWHLKGMIKCSQQKLMQSMNSNTAISIFASIITSQQLSNNHVDNRNLNLTPTTCNFQKKPKHLIQTEKLKLTKIVNRSRITATKFDCKN